MSRKKKVVFILNPISGTRKKALVPELIEQHLSHDLYEYEVVKTERAFHAHELAKGAAEAKADIVVAVGGDGTVNEVASGLLYSSSVLGILPFGSGNGLARHMGIPMDTIEAIRLLNRPSFTIIDAAEANGKPFFCTAGLGFDAHIGRLFATTHTRGFSSYLRMAASEYFNFSPHWYTVKVDGKEISGPFFVVSLANAGQYGNNAYISPEADIKDGLLDLCLLSPFPHYQVVPLAWSLFNKTIHQSSYMQIIRTEVAEVECPRAECMHLDGEFVPVKGAVRISMLPQSLQIAIPKEEKR